MVSALHRVKPHLQLPPVSSFEFPPCGRTPQVGRLARHLHYQWNVRCLFAECHNGPLPAKGVCKSRTSSSCATSLRQAFARCKNFPVSVSQGSLAHVSVLMWLVDQLSTVFGELFPPWRIEHEFTLRRVPPSHYSAPRVLP